MTNSTDRVADQTRPLTLVKSLITNVAGHRFQNGHAAPPGEPVGFVREPHNEADPNAIAIYNVAGQRIGYLFGEIAAEYALMLDFGLAQLAGRLAAPGEPNYNPALAACNSPLNLWVYVDQARIAELEAEIACGPRRPGSAIGTRTDGGLVGRPGRIAVGQGGPDRPAVRRRVGPGGRPQSCLRGGRHILTLVRTGGGGRRGHPRRPA
jgi:hypothetical protein